MSLFYSHFKCFYILSYIVISCLGAYIFPYITWEFRRQSQVSLDKYFLPYFSQPPSETLTLFSLRWSPSLLKRPSSSKITPSVRNFKCSAGYCLKRHMFISTMHLFLWWPSSPLNSVKSTT